MKENFYGKEVGYDDVIDGVIYGQHSHIHGMKEYYTMVLITTYCTLKRNGNERKWNINGETVQFKYPEIFWNYYTYWHAVEDHKNHPLASTIHGPHHNVPITYFYYWLVWKSWAFCWHWSKFIAMNRWKILNFVRSYPKH